jgi:membrane protein DedA with SNARE-associated domain
METLLADYGLAAIFALLAIKAAGVPIPLPADVIMLATAARAADGTFILWQAFLVLAVALVVGGAAEFWLARGPGRELVYRVGSHIGLPPARLDVAAAAVRRSGVAGISLALLTPGVNATTNAAAGLARVPLRIFLPGLVLGSTGDVGAHMALGYAGGAVLERLAQTLPLPVVVAIAAVLLLGGLATWLMLHRHHHPHLPLHQALACAIRTWHRTGTPVLLALHWLWRPLWPRHHRIGIWRASTEHEPTVAVGVVRSV